MKYDLQFFADEEVSTGVEATESADQSNSVSEGVNTEATGDATSHGEAQTPSTGNETIDMNAVYAKVRRSVEAENKKKMDSLNSMFTAAFKDYVDPRTGKPILSAQGFIEAYNWQKQSESEAMLKEKGIDTNTINELINNSPKMREYQQMLDYYKQKETEDLMTKDLARLAELDPNIKTFDDVPQEIINKMQEKGVDMVDAYMLCNFGKVNAQQASAIKQRTLNEISGKQHLTPVSGVAKNENLVDIPSDKLASWRKLFPGLSDAELKKKYNNGLR